VEVSSRSEETRVSGETYPRGSNSLVSARKSVPIFSFASTEEEGGEVISKQNIGKREKRMEFPSEY